MGQKNTGAEKIGGREKDGSRKKTEQEKTKKTGGKKETLGRKKTGAEKTKKTEAGQFINRSFAQASLTFTSLTPVFFAFPVPIKDHKMWN